MWFAGGSGVVQPLCSGGVYLSGSRRSTAARSRSRRRREGGHRAFTLRGATVIGAGAAAAE